MVEMMVLGKVEEMPNALIIHNREGGEWRQVRKS